MDFRTAYGPKADVISNTVGESMTKQSMSKECDINFIINQFTKTGIVTHLESRHGDYADLAGIDFQESMNIVARAQSAFYAVPAEIRAQFGNDPARFVDFVTNDENHKKMVEMGLAYPRDDGEVSPTFVPPEKSSADTPPKE